MKAQFLACGKRNTKTKRQTIATCCNRCKTGLCVTQARRLFARRRCGSCSVFEAAYTVYKYTPNKFSFRAHPKNFVILRVSKDLVETKRQTFFAPVPQLLIINFTAKTASIRVWVFPPPIEPPSRQSCEIAAGVFVLARTDSKDFRRG